MSNYYDNFKIECSPVAKKENMIILNDTRFTILTDYLVRVENTENGIFCDEPTQSVWFRDFSNPKFSSEVKNNRIVIKTGSVEFRYNLSAHKMTCIILDDERKVSEFKNGNLKGTKRTLDRTFGKVKIGDGIISRNGVALLCDSKSLVIKEDGTIVPRESKEKDTYYFAYGYNYIQAVTDFFRLTGSAPLVPRYSLGNWWSRYKAYTQDEYVTLMQRFIDEEIPITVATVDMDWHWVDVIEKFGKNAVNKAETQNIMEKIYDIIFKGGWTGYSWNTDLFPDPQAFVKWLKDKGFKVTLNIHPATGVRWFEDCYADFAEYMGDDPKERKQYPFDITDKKFTEGYFKYLHHPHEDMGVDFWWIDWQQGNKTKTPGLDPLWALNHYHSLDVARNGEKRPLILSRFAGAGSHRYPLGFSGDTAQNWKVLDFQPYFTSTASNIGYTWWSHDIGGHHYGIKDDELYLRWVQFGVFSPVMRLHSTSNEFMGKEPWKFSSSIRKLATQSLRLRHRLLPYIYTMNYRTYNEGRALCEPMYYHYPKSSQAYNCLNEYFFGPKLIVAPITKPKDKRTNLAGTEVWLPEGRFTDIFNGRIYQGGQTIKMFRDEESIPVLACEGAIIPLDKNDRTNKCTNPENMEILIYRGNDSFSMYEDDGETMNFKNGAFALTDFEVKESNSEINFSINKVKGDLSVVPQKRNYTLSFKDVASAKVSVVVNAKTQPAVFSTENGYVSVELCDVSPEDTVNVSLSNITVKLNQDKREMLIELISKFQGKNNPKKTKYTDYVDAKTSIPNISLCFKQPIEEIEHLLY